MLSEVKHPVREREVSIAPEETYDGRILRFRSEPALSLAEGMTIIIWQATGHQVRKLTPGWSG